MKRSYIKTSLVGVVFIDLVRHDDHRGWLIELFRSDCLDSSDFPAMGYVSQTLPGVVRGPHEHRKQSDLFCFVGPGIFELVLSKDNVEERHSVGENHPVAVIVPPGVVHSYENKSDKPGLVFNFPNKLFGGMGGCYPIDEIRHEDTNNTIDSFFV